MSVKDQERVRLGNLLALWLCRVIRVAIRCKTPFLVENPASSRLWIFPPLAALMHKCSMNFVFHACQYGGPALKPTRIVGWNINLIGLDKKCQRQGRVCSAIGVPHVVLQGLDKRGVWLSASASAYPRRFCSALAKEVLDKILTSENPPACHPVHH